MKKWKERLFLLVPAYARLPLLCCVALNFLVYWGCGFLNANRRHYDFTLDIDRRVPLIPAFLVIYFGCYLFWIANYILIARQGREHCMRFVTMDMLSRLICCLIFLAMPTTNIRPELSGGGVFTKMLGMLYQMDAATNLFPSIHCLVSWFCYIGLRGQKGVPVWYRRLSCLIAVLVFISTQVTKQHYVVDIIGAVALAEGAYYIGFHTKAYQSVERCLDHMRHRLFPAWEREEKGARYVG